MRWSRIQGRSKRIHPSPKENIPNVKYTFYHWKKHPKIIKYPSFIFKKTSQRLLLEYHSALPPPKKNIFHLPFFSVLRHLDGRWPVAHHQRAAHFGISSKMVDPLVRLLFKTLGRTATASGRYQGKPSSGSPPYDEGFLKMVGFPTTNPWVFFLPKMIILGCEMGVPPFWGKHL